MKISHVAGCLIVSLLGAEISESKEFLFSEQHLLSIEPRSFNTLVGNPHTHSELDAEVSATTVVPISASGGQRSEEMFRLFVYPAATGFNLIGQTVAIDERVLSKPRVVGRGAFGSRRATPAGGRRPKKCDCREDSRNRWLTLSCSSRFPT